MKAFCVEILRDQEKLRGILEHGSGGEILEAVHALAWTGAIPDPTAVEQAAATCAARGELQSVIRLRRRHGLAWSELLCAVAAAAGEEELLVSICSPPWSAPCGPRTVAVAAAAGHVGVIDVLRKRIGCDWTPQAMQLAVAAGNSAVAAHLLREGCPLSHGVALLAAAVNSAGARRCATWLFEAGKLPLDVSVLCEAARWGSVEFLDEALRARRRAVEETVAREATKLACIAARAGKLRVLRWIARFELSRRRETGGAGKTRRTWKAEEEEEKEEKEVTAEAGEEGGAHRESAKSRSAAMFTECPSVCEEAVRGGHVWLLCKLRGAGCQAEDAGGDDQAGEEGPGITACALGPPLRMLRAAQDAVRGGRMSPGEQLSVAVICGFPPPSSAQMCLSAPAARGLALARAWAELVDVAARGRRRSGRSAALVVLQSATPTERASFRKEAEEALRVCAASGRSELHRRLVAVAPGQVRKVGRRVGALGRAVAAVEAGRLEEAVALLSPGGPLFRMVTAAEKCALWQAAGACGERAVRRLFASSIGPPTSFEAAFIVKGAAIKGNADLAVLAESEWAKGQPSCALWEAERRGNTTAARALSSFYSKCRSGAR